MFPAYPYLGQIFGDYKLLKGIGHGGFADVYLAEHLALGKKVAVKVLNTRLANDSEIQNFKREARVIVALEHPHIIEVYHLGENRRIPFIAMRYSPQGSLRDRHPRGTIVPLETVVKYVKQVAEALQYVHDKGLIHRDIKPHNMLLDQYGNILLSDFGIAIMTDSRRSNPQNLAGTAQYMAPEQALNQAVRASDQYALAITVYEWLTGDVPFHGGNFVEVTAKHALVTPLPLQREDLREKGIDISPEVEQVVLKALSKEPEERYKSIADFALALEAAAVPPNESLTLVPIREYKEHRSFPSAISWSPDGQFIASGGGRVKWEGILPEGITDPVLHVWDPSTGKQIQTFEHDEVINFISWSPDGQYVASGYDFRDLEVWSITANIRMLKQEYSNGRKFDIEWSPNSRYLASGGNANAIYIFETCTGKCLLTYGNHADQADHFAWLPEGDRILLKSLNHPAILIDVTTGNQISDHRYSWLSNANKVAWSPNGKFIVAETKLGSISIFEDETGKELASGNCAYSVDRFIWSPDSRCVASINWVDLYFLHITGKPMGALRIGSVRLDKTFSFTKFADNRYLAFGIDDIIRIWDIVSEELKLTMQFQGDIAAIDYSPDSQKIAVCANGAAIIYEVRKKRI